MDLCESCGRTTLDCTYCFFKRPINIGCLKRIVRDEELEKATNDRWPGSIVYRAILYKKKKVLPILISLGANLNDNNPVLGPPICKAMTVRLKKGKLSYLRILLEAGANPNVSDDGFTPLHLACMSMDLEATRLLMEHGADTSIKDIHGHDCLDTSSGKITDFLLQYNEEFSIPDVKCAL